MRAFLSHSSADSEFCIEVAKYIRRNLNDGVFYYEECQRADQTFVTTINNELSACDVIVVFIGNRFDASRFQIDEANTAHRLHNEGNPKNFFIVLLPGQVDVPTELASLGGFPVERLTECAGPSEAVLIARWIIGILQLPWLSADDLPYNPHLFSYEKDIIRYFVEKGRQGPQSFQGVGKEAFDIRQKWLDGCPADWPKVVRWEDRNINEGLDRLIEAELTDNKQERQAYGHYRTWRGLDEDAVGQWRSDDNFVVTAALSGFHAGCDPSTSVGRCMIRDGFFFPEAGPRMRLYYPRSIDRELKVAIVVSGGIAPGINAVIDGITQRHLLYGESSSYVPVVLGLQNGFLAFDDISRSQILLSDRWDRGATPQLVTAEHAGEGGSVLGTARTPALLDHGKRLDELTHIANQLLDLRIDILYVIGGDGSMKAAHALWSIAQQVGSRRTPPRRLSVVSIPKTMDNDILWVWQAFGFLSAVEKARQIVDDLATEVSSNPRLCVLQLFGSDSGFVVSHTVLASRRGHCDVALIPEVPFSMKGLNAWLRYRISIDRRRIPFGLVVMAETAVPTDAMDFIDNASIGLSTEEKRAIRRFDELRNQNRRIEGQTDDELRSAALKIVSRGLKEWLPRDDRSYGNAYMPPPLPATAVQPRWELLRVFTNEPRHLLRAIVPSCSDIINGHRLGTLAVDNAMAGYTDFMISQWLTEYVLVPLRLVTLGRKRIPESGIFWKSVLAKTGQPAKML